MKSSLFFYKELTAAEVGATKTHETYIRLNNSFDYNMFFHGKAVEKGTVVECSVEATNLTPGDFFETIRNLRFVYYVNNTNKEKRIPGLAPLFSENSVKEGDIICLESRQDENGVNFYFKFIPKGTIQLFGQSLFFGSSDEIVDSDISISTKTDSDPRQIIWYGAPGTGKSYTVNKETNKTNSVRTTFHPDTDYASFVGAYKPTLQPVKQIYHNIQGREEEISYKFVPQVFLKAYVNAWKRYAENPEEPTPYFLVIEEINRGNCAQIFGDLFQLLDREDNGFSTYEIVPDTDIEKFLRDDVEWGFAGIAEIGEFSKDIKEGKIMRLPSNLFIYATMNTSDQSLFPIDSAFKRRWEWRYTPIAKPAAKNWTLAANGKSWNWWEFLRRINFEIGHATESEDKKLGYFFTRAKKTDPKDYDNNNGVIEAATFVSKVLFYLWNDVIKDNDFNADLLTDPNGKALDFTRFFKIENGESKVDESLVEHFINNIMKVELPSDGSEVTGLNEDAGKAQIMINGEPVKFINAVPYTTIRKFIEMHPEMSAAQIYDEWLPFAKYSLRPWVVSTEPQDYAEQLTCADGSFVWVNKDGWMHDPTKQRDTLQEFIDAVNAADNGITITENKANA